MNHTKTFSLIAMDFDLNRCYYTKDEPCYVTLNPCYSIKDRPSLQSRNECIERLFERKVELRNLGTHYLSFPRDV